MGTTEVSNGNYHVPLFQLINIINLLCLIINIIYYLVLCVSSNTGTIVFQIVTLDNKLCDAYVDIIRNRVMTRCCVNISCDVMLGYDHLVEKFPFFFMDCVILN